MTSGRDGSAADAFAPGTLVVVATPIGNLDDVSRRAIDVLAAADVVCCEDTRRTGLMLKRLGIAARRLVALHAHNEAARADEVVTTLRTGAVVALVTDAGTPAISDPGARLVAAVADGGLTVSAVPGPAAVVTALSVAGMQAERFAFEGFLPRRGVKRAERLGEIARAVVPVVVYEAPTRAHATLVELAEVCGADRSVVVARELTKQHEQVWRGTLGDASLHPVPERGEFVIIVGGLEGGRARRDVDLVAPLERLRDAGLRARDAANAVAILLGVARRDAYAAALGVYGEGAGPQP